MLVGAFLVATVAVPIPVGGYDGYWLRSGNTSEVSVHLEIFGDLICPDTRASWPTMRAVMREYGNALAFGFHRFPLPYHHNAFYAWQARAP